MRNTLVEGLSENRRLCGGHVRCEIESEEPVVFWELIALAAQYECNERPAMRVLDRFEGNLAGLGSSACPTLATGAISLSAYYLLTGSTIR